MKGDWTFSPLAAATILRGQALVSVIRPEECRQSRQRRYRPGDDCDRPRGNRSFESIQCNDMRRSAWCTMQCVMDAPLSVPGVLGAFARGQDVGNRTYVDETLVQRDFFDPDPSGCVWHFYNRGTIGPKLLSDGCLCWIVH